MEHAMTTATTAAPDGAAFKQAMRAQWDRSADGWDAHAAAVRAWLRRATDAMLDLAGVRPGARVLDVAAGAGDPTLDIARRVGAGGHVLATDLSPAILALAQRHAEDAGLRQVHTRVADGEHLPLDDAGFDAAVCRLGLMLFPDPLQGLREMRRVTRPGGTVCTLVFGRPEANPCVALVMRTALAHAGLPPRDPFTPGGLLSLGAPGRIDALCREAGLREVATTALAAPFELPSVRHYVQFLRDGASPVHQVLARLAPPAAEAAWADIEAELARFTTAQGWVGPNELLLTVGKC
jgi:ubiquinone/menaquinone biosynthesis C-methylase UbiE